jgi:putative FmdB family regulatory protein
LNPPIGRSRIFQSSFTAVAVEASMPHYEFVCLDCKKNFVTTLSVVDYVEGDVVCPHCGSENVEQRWSVFSVITSKKSA